MEPNPTATATQIRYQQWLADIRECNERPQYMTVDEWCRQHGIKKNTYYWRMKTLRKLCLRNAHQLPAEPQTPEPTIRTSFVELPQTFPTPEEAKTVTLTIGHASIEIPETIPDDFLRRILEAASHA